MDSASRMASAPGFDWDGRHYSITVAACSAGQRWRGHDDDAGAGLARAAEFEVRPLAVSCYAFRINKKTGNTMGSEQTEGFGAVFMIDGTHRFMAKYVRKSARLGRIHINGYPAPDAPRLKIAPVGVWVGPLAGEFSEKDFMLIAIAQFAKLWNSDRPNLEARPTYELDFDPVVAKYAGNIKWVDTH
ncbi:hypothetical protein J8I26_00705 [Herbaspirillum sp. LeCh32-8]|uniref:hypothetical protein n=1 Tax=Herbaspirillum sp. LeCh32-8 TaxID=2821356 RepID=UPI001AE118B3|nr:hypothetical protein [Herbaspirillum sp. LeCh32-8]MBP0596612.1 hypothetical protein [Herbaspirillum sp. LeCh32-8]